MKVARGSSRRNRRTNKNPSERPGPNPEVQDVGHFNKPLRRDGRRFISKGDKTLWAPFKFALRRFHGRGRDLFTVPGGSGGGR